MNNVSISVPGVIIGNIPAVVLLALFGSGHLALGHGAGACATLLGIYLKKVLFGEPGKGEAPVVRVPRLLTRK